MVTFEDKKLILFIVVKALVFLSSVGLAVCAIVRLIFYGSEAQMMENSFWFGTVIAFGGIFIFALVVLVPAGVFLIGRKERKHRKLDKLTFGDLIALPFGGANPDAEVPRWIKYPVLALLFLLIGLVGLIILGGIISYFVKQAGG